MNLYLPDWSFLSWWWWWWWWHVTVYKKESCHVYSKHWFAVSVSICSWCQSHYFWRTCIYILAAACFLSDIMTVGKKEIEQNTRMPSIRITVQYANSTSTSSSSCLPSSIPISSVVSASFVAIHVVDGFVLGSDWQCPCIQPHTICVQHTVTNLLAVNALHQA